MPMTDEVFRSLSCDGPKCDKIETFEVTSSDPVEAQRLKVAMEKKIAETPWLQSPRIVQAAGKQFIFCSDPCLVDAAAAGLFVPEAEKKIIPPVGNATAQIREALLAKSREKMADAALRSGAPVQISPK